MAPRTNRVRRRPAHVKMGALAMADLGEPTR
jgi:hypothetical protein